MWPDHWPTTRTMRYPADPAALRKGSPEWRRATDIVLASEPTDDDLKDLAKGGSAAPRKR